MERKLAAVLSTDVKGYSRLMGEDEVATIRTLTAYRELMTTLIQQHRGCEWDGVRFLQYNILPNILIEWAATRKHWPRS